MSTIIDPTTPLFSMENASGGLDIQGFQDQENRLIGTDGNDFIIGGDKNDIIFSLGGNDTIDGRGGNDTISGGEGIDSLIGGSGADVFVFDRNSALTSGEIDIITDFVPGEDTLGIQGLLEGDNVDYNRDTGILTLNGQAFARIDRELPLQDNQLDFEDLVFDGLPTDDGGSDSGNDVFSFDRDSALTSGEVIRIDDFDPGEDKIRIEGIASGDNIDYNRDSGILSINGQDFAQIDRELPLDDSDFELI